MENKEKYINDIKEALENISPYYIVSNNSHGYNERIFAYEFYHQYRLIMMKEENDGEFYHNKYLSGEQSKVLDNKLIQQKTSKTILENCIEVADEASASKYVSPDIVLSGDVEALNENEQYWIAEIKMEGNTKICSDLPKLDVILQSLSFKMKVFICVVEKDLCLKEKIRKMSVNSEIDFFFCVNDKSCKKIKAEHLLIAPKNQI